MKRSLIFLFAISLVTLAAGAQSVPPSVGELSYSLISPEYLGGGLHVTKARSPQGVYLNPASAAGFQRIILDVNYANLQGLGDKADGMGHAANLAISVPTRRGVFSGGLGFLDTSAYSGTDMDLGTSGHMFVTFSKEIYSDLWVGTGINGSLGKLDGSFQGGGSLSFGFLHFPETFGGLKNFQWGGTLSGIGYQFGSSSRGYFNSIPGNLTLAAGMAFDVVEAEKFKWTFRSDVRVPSLSDLRVGIGSDLYFGDTARMSISSSLDVRDAFEGAWQTIIPSAAVAVSFPLGGKSSDSTNPMRTTEMDVQIAAAPLYDGVWAFAGGFTLPFGVRDENPPAITVDYDPPQYISPNYDGIQDELLISYEVTDERFISSYTWKVTDSDGTPVRTYVNKDERPENESVKNLWSRLISPKVGTSMPDQFRWDGVSDTGSVAVDGSYNVYLEFSDDNDNSAVAGPYPVVVDTVAPELSLEVPEGLDLIFSPDGDGYKDSLSIEQSGSVEQLWEASFSGSSDTVVRGWAWAETAPESFEWDGKNDSGEIVNDGVYRYFISSTDRAGNSSSAAIEGIIVDTLQPEIGLSIDRSIFSPGTYSSVSTVTLIPNIAVRSGIVDWTLEIIDSDGGVIQTWSRRESPAIQESVVFNGMDSAGRQLKEGSYNGRLEVVYGNGFQPEVLSPPFIVDITAPTASVSANWTVFSPQSGSRRNQVTFTQRTSSEELWYGKLSDSEGNEVNGWTWIEMADNSLVWDGRDAEGRLVSDGSYTYTLESVDRAGNAGNSSPVSITVDTSSVEASVTASLDVFGPTGNGIKDRVRFFTSAKTESPISGWTLTVKDTSGNEIRNWSGKGAPPDNVEWDGRLASGTSVPDGVYLSELRVQYEKGDVADAVSGSVVVDTVPPRIDVSIDIKLFSPDGDGEVDSIIIDQSSSEEVIYNGYFSNAEGDVVRSLVWSGSLETFDWDGTDNSGNKLPDGDYSYRVVGADKAGNETQVTTRGIRIDTAATPVYLTASQGYIKAGETDANRMQTFAAVVPNSSGIASWTFVIADDNDRVVHRESGVRSVPEGFTWNGTNSSGRPVEGIFKGILTVVYSKGSKPVAESRPFVSDGSPPDVTVTLTPQPFSPDGDNVDDEVVISLRVEDRSRISEWSLKIFDPRGREFITFSGRGRPSERIIWDGRSGKGELVQSAEDYPYVLTVTDILGHTSIEEGQIAVDVLVIREGDRLKILINNITFQPSSPQLILTGDEGQKNKEVLDRLAEIMQKYNSYHIVVEGHAVSLRWADPAAAQREQKDILVPLSRSRAQTVVDELVARRVPANRMQAVGIGGDKPIVPHGNLEERWRNRRVEFYLEK